MNMIRRYKSFLVNRIKKIRVIVVTCSLEFTANQSCFMIQDSVQKHSSPG